MALVLKEPHINFRRCLIWVGVPCGVPSTLVDDQALVHFFHQAKRVRTDAKVTDESDFAYGTVAHRQLTFM
jgi:hypothetical protein